MGVLFPTCVSAPSGCVSLMGTSKQSLEEPNPSVRRYLADVSGEDVSEAYVATLLQE